MKRNIFTRVYRFIKYNDHKRMSLYCWFFAAWYRFWIKYGFAGKMKHFWGSEGEESAWEESRESYIYAKSVSYWVNQVCTKTAWESKCLVRALIAQRLLARKKIHSTLYLGCRLEEGKMVAHAWLRCGRLYVTGGNGEKDGYAVVDKFKK